MRFSRSDSEAGVYWDKGNSSMKKVLNYILAKDHWTKDSTKERNILIALMAVLRVQHSWISISTLIVIIFLSFFQQINNIWWWRSTKHSIMKFGEWKISFKVLGECRWEEQQSSTRQHEIISNYLYDIYSGGNRENKKKLNGENWR